LQNNFIFLVKEAHATEES